ncbi:MAG: terpene synthase family protein [Roseiflexus sp.]|nr:terpene synthase family protein [Roseiflexus sp.]
MTTESWYWRAVEAINYPFPQRMHRDASWLESEIINWCRTHQLVQNQAQEQRLRSALLAEFVARANADISRTMLRLIGLWTVWFFLLDDLTDSIHSVEMLADLHTRILAVVGGDEVCRHDHPLTQAAADLSVLLRRHAGSVTLVRFQRALAQTLESHLWEISTRIADVQPDDATYTNMRLWSGAFLPMIALADIARGFVLPSHIFDHAIVQELIHTATQAVLWYNDLWSYPKEIQVHKAPHNIVHILAREYRVSLSEALSLAIAQHDQALQRFFYLKQQIRHLDNDDRQVACFVESIEGWLRATQDWSRRTDRYRQQIVRTFSV